MPYQLSEGARATALRAARAMFPHDGLPDSVYASVVDQLEADAAADAEVAATVDAGAARSAAPTRSTRPRCARTTASRSSSCSRPTAVVAIYDNPEVWKAFGYEGAAAHLGGYVERGFDDLDWLPDPPIELDPTAGSHHA